MMGGGAYYFLVPTGTLEDWSKLPEARLRTLRLRRAIIAAVCAAVTITAILLAALAPLGVVAMGVTLVVIVVALVQLIGSLSIVIGTHRQIRAIEYERSIPEDRPRSWPT